MQVVLLIRHAVAAEREEWRGDDMLRPLTDAGRRQAKRLVRVVQECISGDRHAVVTSLRTSPATRCVQTVEPLSHSLGMDLQVDQALREGSRIVLPSLGSGGVHVICAHGDNIPWLLDVMQVDWDGRCKKGSIWEITRDGRGRVTSAEYHTVSKD